MPGKPWWWPKSHQDVDRLMERTKRFHTDIRLFLLMQTAIIACEVFYAFGMSLCLVTILTIMGRDIINANIYSLVAICVFGLICSRLAYTFNHDIFREMSEGFLGIPLSRMTKEKLREEFWVDI